MQRIIFLFVLGLFMPAYAARTVVTQTPYSFHSPYYNNYYAEENRFREPYYPQNYSRINAYSNDFNQLEKYAFNRTFSREHELSRLERLEELAFGTVQQGEFETRYRNARSAILSRPKYSNQNQSVFKTIGNYFSGQLTGYTPQFDDRFFNNTPSTFGNKRYTTYSSPWRSGYRYDNYGTSSSSGIKILD